MYKVIFLLIAIIIWVVGMYGILIYCSHADSQDDSQLDENSWDEDDW